MEFRILGPLEVSSGQEPLDLGGRKQRALLALLLLNPNRVVPVDSLIAALWDDDPPGSARKALQIYVSQVRKTLGRDRIATQPPGYLLHVQPDELDLARFEQLRAEGALDEALSLWRGPALSEFGEDRFAQGEIARLEELRLATIGARIERDLADGRHRELIGELEALARDHPTRERLRGQQMLALYRSGRQADALDTYRQTREALVEELGIEPGRELRELQQAILNQDSSLEAPAALDARGDGGDASRRRLPSGTVTLLFADIEGSTKLVRDLGERFAGARSRVRELVRTVVERHRGQEVDWAGDGPFVVFERAGDAVEAAADLQRVLAAESWPTTEPLRMRVGIHTGEPELDAEGYVGLDVHLAARICAAAHGGQVVVSRTTRGVVTLDPSLGIDFRSLGQHKLKDIPGPETLFQLIGPGLEGSFPPLQSLGGAALPALHHRFVGRQEDLGRIATLLSRPDVRLVTITGTGGAGKSRLALEVAAAAAVDRTVHLVGLASISDSELVPAAIARAIGVRESPGQSLLEGIADELVGTGTLLVLDNLEHLTAAAHDVVALLDRAHDLVVLATSRSPLRLSSEHVLQLAPLPIDDAVTLFLELAAARGVVLREESLPTIREICERLDGLPLAVELVVAPLAVLPPDQLLRALDDGLGLDMKAPIDLPERQQTLRTTIEWSYGLVSACQRSLHGALAVFRGGAPLDALQVVCDDLTADLLGDLSALVDGGLVRRETTFDAEPRFAMLATVREYALDVLAKEGQLEEMQALHADYFLDLCEEAGVGFAGDEPAIWLDRIERDLDNVRAALGFAFQSGRVELGLRIGAALARFWRARAHVGEARFWLTLGLGLPGAVATEVRARALDTAALQAAAQSDWLVARTMFDEARELYAAEGRSLEEVLVLAYLSFVARMQGDMVVAESFAVRAVEIAAGLDDDRARSGALLALGDVYSAQEKHRLALSQYEEAIPLRVRFGDPLLVLDAAYNLGLAAFRAGERERAREALVDALERARALGEAPYVAAAQLMLAELDFVEGDQKLLESRARESLTLYTDLDDDRSRARCLVLLAAAAAASGAGEDAARLVGAAEAARGSRPLDEFELPVLEQILPSLRDTLGASKVESLKAEGRRVDAGVTASEIVTMETKA